MPFDINFFSIEQTFSSCFHQMCAQKLPTWSNATFSKPASTCKSRRT